MTTFPHSVNGKSYNIRRFPINDDETSCEEHFDDFVESREEAAYDEGTNDSCVTYGGKSSPKEDILIYAFYKFSLLNFNDYMNDFIVYLEESRLPGLSTEKVDSHTEQAMSFYQEAQDSYYDIIWSSEKYKQAFPNDHSEMTHPDALKEKVV